MEAQSGDLMPWGPVRKTNFTTCLRRKNINVGNWLKGILKAKRGNRGLHRSRSSCPWGAVRRGGGRNAGREGGDQSSLPETQAAAAWFPS